MIYLECEWSARFSHKREKGSSSRARGVRRRHSDAAICVLVYRMGRSCIKATASGS